MTQVETHERYGEIVGTTPGGRLIVANGFGGTTTVTPTVDHSGDRAAVAAREARVAAHEARFPTHTPRASAAPTEKQIAFLRKLLAERAGVAEAETVRDGLNALREVHMLDRVAASKAIESLLKVAKPRAAAPAGAAPVSDPLPEVPEGRYAIRTKGVVKFYKVDRPTEGRWAGWTFVKVQASDELWPIKGEARRPVLEAIAADPQGASALYGHELGVCGVCGRTLTDEDSRARGIGPVCAAARGW